MINVVFLCTILVFTIVLVYLINTNSQSESLYDGDGFIMAIIIVVLVVISIACILCGNYIVRLAIRKSRNSGILLFAHILRMSFFEAVAIYGLILGIMDGRWVAWAFILPFFLAAAVPLVRTFPTEEKWAKELDDLPHGK